MNLSGLVRTILSVLAIGGDHRDTMLFVAPTPASMEEEMNICHLYRRHGTSMGSLALIVILVALLGLTACGGGDEQTQADDTVAGNVTRQEALPLPATLDTTPAEHPVAPGSPDPETVPPTEPVTAETAAAPAAEPEPVTATAPAVEPVPAPPTAEPVTGAYSLQLGAFRRPGNAAALQARLGELGYDAAVEIVQLDSGTLQRVVLYGFADRTEAEQVGEAIHRRLDLEYLIRRRP